MSDVFYPALHGRQHCPGGEDPIPCLTSASPWAIITDGSVQSLSGVEYQVGGQFYGTNDLVQDYYVFTARNATYPGMGSYDYYTVYVAQRGLYLLDFAGQTETWGAVTDGWAYFKLDPNQEAWYPFGFGTFEDQLWIDRHVTHDATNGAVDTVFRINGIASLDEGTEFFPKFQQTTGVDNLVAQFTYFKIVRLQDYEAIADLDTGSLI